MWDNAFMIRIKKDMVKMTTDNSDNGHIMVAHLDSERFLLFYSSLWKHRGRLASHQSCFVRKGNSSPNTPNIQ